MRKFSYAMILSLVLLIAPFYGTTIEAATDWEELESTASVSADKEWKIQFSMKMDKDTFSSSNVYVLDSEGNRVHNDLTLSDDQTNGYVSAPAGGYEEGHYTLFIEKNLLANGSENTLEKGILFRFTVGNIENFSNQELTVEELTAQNSPGVVVIKGYNSQQQFQSQGSGFSVGHGLVLTNYHVIDGNSKLEIFTESGETVPVAGVVKYDEIKDLALLKPETKIDIPDLNLGSFNDINRGERVIAIGSPEGLFNSISDGIVSGLRYTENEGTKVNVIQTSAPITHGSSGGPLFNMNGEVLGVTTFGYESGNLNFAIGIDYAKEWVSEYKNMTFSDIPVLDVDFGISSGEESSSTEEEENESTETEKTTTDQGSTDSSDTTSDDTTEDSTSESNEPVLSQFGITEQISNVIEHPTKPVVYGVGVNNNVVEVNLDTEEVREQSFSETPERLFFANNELYVTLLKGQHDSYWWEEDQKGAFAILDPSTMEVKEQINIPFDPFDLVATQDSVYISGGSGQWTDMISYDRTNAYIKKDSTSIRQQSYLELDANGTQIYAIDTDSSPRDMESFHVNQGMFSNSYDSPYHGDYDLNPDITLSNDGKYIFNSFGNVFTSSSNKDTNMTFLTSIQEFDKITFDLDNDRFFVLTGSQIFEYNYQTFKVEERYDLNSEPMNVMYTSTGLYVITKKTLPDSNLPQMVLQQLDLK